jgi:oligoribonuclease NrnB/cAMP/cGMP phosphodiesterase (DHH superfamily)
MKIINVTHHDLDGIGCPIVLKVAFPREVLDVYYCSYHDVEAKVAEVIEDLRGVKKVYITDISFRKESGLTEKIDAINKAYYKRHGEYQIEVYDHHATSSYLNAYDWAQSHEVDETGKENCGTMWLYKAVAEKLNMATLDEFVRLVNLYDTWRWVNDFPAGKPYEPAKNLNMIFGIMGKKEFFNTYVRRIRKDKELFSRSDIKMLTYKLNEISGDVAKKNKELMVTDFTYETKQRNLSFIESYLKENWAKVGKMDYLLNPDYKKTFKVGICFCSRNISDVGNELCRMNPQLDFIILINLPNAISFRSSGKLEVPLGIIAQYVTGKGGGHPQSAGSVVTQDKLMKILETIFD